MGISIIGISNVKFEYNYDNDINDTKIIYYDYENKKTYLRNDNSKEVYASRSYSGLAQLMRKLYKYSIDVDIKYNMINMPYDGFVNPSGKTYESQLFLNNIYNKLIEKFEEDEEILENTYDIGEWDIEFTGLMLEAFKLCNDSGILVFS